MGLDLGCEHGDVMASVRLTGNVELLALVVLGELLEEEREEGVDVLSSSDGIGHRSGGVGVADVNRLIEENDRGIGVPRVRVMDRLEILTNGSRTKLKEQSRQRRTSGTSVQPQNNGIVLGVVSGLEEPVEKVLVLVLNVKVARVLLDLVQTERRGVLGSKGVVGELRLVGGSVQPVSSVSGGLSSSVRKTVSDVSELFGKVAAKNILDVLEERVGGHGGRGGQAQSGD